ncbi:MAG: hypothetical protein EA421_15910 [Gemmatimonadales bacterium]|nr:MAG: hypothetical protein EA421_15910 [Gemmatimonadales bacterium]
MKRATLLGLTLFLASGCIPFTRGPSTPEDRMVCDRLAAQAIAAVDLGEARRLAEQASDCYDRLRG